MTRQELLVSLAIPAYARELGAVRPLQVRLVGPVSFHTVIAISCLSGRARNLKDGNATRSQLAANFDVPIRYSFKFVRLARLIH
jgi:hypothetical protein